MQIPEIAHQETVTITEKWKLAADNKYLRKTLREREQYMLHLLQENMRLRTFSANLQSELEALKISSAQKELEKDKKILLCVQQVGEVCSSVENFIFSS